MNQLGTMLMLLFVSCLGLIGLILAANALDTGMAIFGGGLALFAVLFDFWLLKLYADANYENRA